MSWLDQNVIAIINLRKDTKEDIEQMLAEAKASEFPIPINISDMYKIYLAKKSIAWLCICPKNEMEYIPRPLEKLLKKKGIKKISTTKSFMLSRKKIGTFLCIDILDFYKGKKELDSSSPLYIRHRLLHELFGI